MFITLMLLALSAAPLFSQEGPYVPCVGCDDFVSTPPYPESGLWYNPDQSGTGFDLEFQNGIMAGHYFGYDETGEPEWYLLTNKLVRSEQHGVMWELEVQPERYTGGSCLGCEYRTPVGIELLPAIKIEFLQRAYAKVTLSDGTIQYMVPIIYGSEARAFFDEKTPYKFPVLPVSEPAIWNFVSKPRQEGEAEPWRWSSDVFFIAEGQSGYPDDRYVSYSVTAYASPPEELITIGHIICGSDDESSDPECVFEANNYNDPLNPYKFKISIGNFTDTRFYGETENGETVQGFRLDYD